jgi:hypothetical protein
VSDDYDPVYSLHDVCDRLDNIQRAIEDSNSSFGWQAIVVIVWLVMAGSHALWHSKMRYSWWYDVKYDQVTAEKEPTDCDFIRAPIGDKGCYYEPQVSTVRVKTVYLDFQRGSVNDVSFDEGRTWTVDDANPPTKPQVVVSWEKVED